MARSVVTPLDLAEVPTPGSNPVAGVLRLYAKSDDKLYILTSGGTETQVGSGTGGSSKTFAFFAG
jgi:predicted small integral membrane protein